MSLYGLLNLNKPPGVTSRRAVDQVVRLVKPAKSLSENCLGEGDSPIFLPGHRKIGTVPDRSRNGCKVGHAGTLDPLASGVLVVGIGAATRLVEYVQAMPKQYRATFLLGRSSTTEDVEGEVTLHDDAPRPTLAALERAAAQLVGEILQRPPVFSALKVSGRRAYALARAGQEVELAPRPISVHRLEITRYEYPELCFDVDCGSGTYVRSLGRDLAELVGTTAVMSALVRTAIGPFSLEKSIPPAELSRESIDAHLLPAVLAVRGLMPQCRVSSEELARLANGLPIERVQLIDPPSEAGVSTGSVAALDDAGRLVAILIRRDDGQYTPSKFFAGR